MAVPTATASSPSERTFRIGDVFGRAFGIFGRRFVPFIVLTVIAYVPTYLVAVLAQTPRPGEFNGWVLVSTVASLVCGVIASGAVVYGVVQDLRTRPFSIAESVQIALRRILPMIGVGICVGVLAGLATLLLIVPGFIVLCMYYVAADVCIVEQQGVFASMARSSLLTKGHRWKIFGIVLLLIVVNLVVAAVLGLIAVALGPRAAGFVVQAWQVLVGAFGAVVSGVLYYQLRVAKDGVDINQIASVFD